MSTPLTPEGAAPGSPGALERVSDRFELKWNEVLVGASRLWLPELAEPTAYIEQRMAIMPDGKADLPYWTKLWPAAMVMAQFALRLTKGKDPLLELGSGLGLPGLVAAAGGRPVVLSDLDPDALEFARAAAEKSGLGDLVSVRRLDWEDPPEDLGSFGTVLGAEVLYHPPLYPRLVELLGELLTPGGTAFISHEARPFAISFFDLAGARFSVRRTTSRLGKGEDATTVYLYALTARQAA
ncbi:MAG: methyltransferase domain-containing protein [Desulfarculaceae bacterium]|nr:methyltransferase domain-containing protein [Desulfarculaceae bacterium]MCF8070952.1 methyltransferase domain-containing protein [Desulfarculaceae bacterium]MCF8100540.1 methyltransferase domain-containing protein [Desulfarculaceae bacterium]MCF8116566.1 methyltransferase domain-containing protein [Desulfarculaceae bacterium]